MYSTYRFVPWSFGSLRIMKPLSGRPATPGEQDAWAERNLLALMRRAYRRPVGQADLAPLMKLYAAGRADGGSFEAGIEPLTASINGRSRSSWACIESRPARAPGPGRVLSEARSRVLEEIADAILQDPAVVRVGVDGPDGSGKSAVAMALSQLAPGNCQFGLFTNEAVGVLCVFSATNVRPGCITARVDRKSVV